MTKRTLTDLIQQEQTATPRRKVPTKADLEQTLEEVYAQLAQGETQIQTLTRLLAEAEQERDKAQSQLALVQQEAQVLAQANAQLMHKTAQPLAPVPVASQAVTQITERKPMVLPPMNDDSSEVWLL